jgi:hypothetical protein
MMDSKKYSLTVVGIWANLTVNIGRGFAVLESEKKYE